MRTLAILVSTIIVLGSCNQREKELEQKITELELLDSLKNEDITAFIDGMTDIQIALDSIKELEGIVTTRAIDNPENPSSAEDAIVGDMMLIYQNLKTTRDRIQRLEKKLEQSSIASEKMKSLLASLKQELKQKDEEIVRLKEGLVESNIYIDKLMSSVDRLAMENERRIKVIQEKNVELQKKEEEIQKGFWASGNVKDLRTKDIIDKEGAFLGLGGVKVVSEDMRLQDLTEINILETTEITIDSKKAELVTPHPTDSYEFVEGDNKKIGKLLVKDPEAFWQNSKVLVIVTN